MCAYVCVCVRGTDNNNLVLFSDTTLIWQGFSQPELNSQARLFGLRTLEIYLFLSLPPWDSKPPLRWVLGIGLRSLCLQSSILPTDLCSQTPRHLHFKFRILFWSKQEIIGTNIQLSVLFNVCVRSKYLLKIVSSGHWFNPINFGLSFWLHSSFITPTLKAQVETAVRWLGFKRHFKHPIEPAN